MITETEQKADFSAFIKFIRSHYLLLTVYALLGAGIGFTLTLLIPKEYKSYGIIYPPSSTSIDNSIDFPNFGYDLEADRLIQILGSNGIRDSVNKKFNLAEHFKITTENPEWLDNFTKLYYKHILFERSSSMSVIISTRTKDPVLSAQVVNYIISSVESLRERIYKKNIISAFENAKSDYDLQKNKVDSAEAVLIEVLKKNNLSSLLMSDAQLMIDIEKLNASDLTGDQAGVGPQLILFKDMYDVLKEYKSRYLKIKKSYDNPIPKLFVINYAEPNYKKTSPSFLLNCLMASLFSLFVATVILFVRQRHASK
jgi:uncharacterized protein involved in exopolysaccharide biosynthesis